jgi:hypothetical protein
MEAGEDKYFYIQAVPFDPPVPEVEEDEDIALQVEQNQELFQQIFNYIDSNKTGEISVNELTSALFHFGYELTLQQVSQIIDTFDMDNSGTMNFPEFVEFMKPVIQQYHRNEALANEQQGLGAAIMEEADNNEAVEGETG